MESADETIPRRPLYRRRSWFSLGIPVEFEANSNTVTKCPVPHRGRIRNGNAERFEVTREVLKGSQDGGFRPDPRRTQLHRVPQRHWQIVNEHGDQWMLAHTDQRRPVPRDRIKGPDSKPDVSPGCRARDHEPVVEDFNPFRVAIPFV